MARRRKGRSVHGVLVLDKPDGITSNSALQRAKRIFGAAKAGHTGSLDPLATGVLPLCFGEATKFSQYVLDAEKAYTSTFALGVATDTLDAEGEVTNRSDARALTIASVRSALESLTGVIEQIPPMYSALKRDGQPLYKLARQGLEVERKARTVTISRFDLLDFRPGQCAYIDVDVTCSKGTYIRSLAESVGQLLSMPAHVSALRRTAAGGYRVDDVVTLERLESLAEQGPEALDALLLPMESPLHALEVVELGQSAAFYLRQGQPVLVPKLDKTGMLRIYGPGNEFMGIGELQEDGRLAPRRLVVT